MSERQALFVVLGLVGAFLAGCYVAGCSGH